MLAACGRLQVFGVNPRVIELQRYGALSMISFKCMLQCAICTLTLLKGMFKALAHGTSSSSETNAAMMVRRSMALTLRMCGLESK